MDTLFLPKKGNAAHERRNEDEATLYHILPNYQTLRKNMENRAIA